MALDTSKLRKRLPPPVEEGHPAIDAPPPSHSAPPRQERPTAPPSDVPRLDGRSLRATGRTVQLNLKVSAETKARMLALAETRGQLMAEVFEDAIAALEREAGR
jgi:hypothetical protein